LGIALGGIFIVWFVSGIVMMYARMPVLDEADRLRRLPPLNAAEVKVAPSPEQLRGATRVIVGTVEGRPVYRLQAGRSWRAVFADTGEVMPPPTPERALAIVRAHAPEHAGTVRYDARLDDADQWSFGVRTLMPMHRVALGDADDTRVYVSDRTAAVVLTTTASGRRWGYAGAVLHWIYFTPFRRQAALWTDTIVWLSIAGTIASMTGLIWGVVRFSPARRYHVRGAEWRSPYAGWMRWHHISGLLFGAVTVTWVFSGLLSMGPWDWAPSTAPTRAQREALSGGPLDFSSVLPERLAAAVEAFGAPSPAEVELIQFRGAHYVRGPRGIVAIDDPSAGVRAAFARDAVAERAQAAMPSVTIREAVWLDRDDAYYYARDRHLPLPVLRVKYDDPQQTWLYLDPSRGIVARKEERLSRLNRWLYHGFHSLDFPFLYYRRPLWDLVVITLSLGGIVLSATTLTTGLRRLRRRARGMAGVVLQDASDAVTRRLP
jgi:hypothetical protein